MTAEMHDVQEGISIWIWLGIAMQIPTFTPPFSKMIFGLIEALFLAQE